MLPRKVRDSLARHCRRPVDRFEGTVLTSSHGLDDKASSAWLAPSAETPLRALPASSGGFSGHQFFEELLHHSQPFLQHRPELPAVGMVDFDLQVAGVSR